MKSDFVLFAPNVSSGGGYVLLKALLAAWPANKALCAVLDERARTSLVIPQHIEVLLWVQPSITSRWTAEKALRNASSVDGTVLCFHGLPPLLPTPGRVIVFLQNRLYLGFDPLANYTLRTATRIRIERFVSRLFRYRVAEYLVQTPTMARDLIRWYVEGNVSADAPALRVLPFMDVPPTERTKRLPNGPSWDFIYVADGEAHKNHRVLAEAWRLLAEDGLYPSLALTLASRHVALKHDLDITIRNYGLQISDLGQMSHDEVIALYRRVNALIFPSTSESFGLPLIEATRAGLPVLAPELDYVRDVCVPVQTFDPDSPVSIARAVKRFLGCAEPVVKLLTPVGFWQAVLAVEFEFKE